MAEKLVGMTLRGHTISLFRFSLELVIYRVQIFYLGYAHIVDLPMMISCDLAAL